MATSLPAVPWLATLKPQLIRFGADLTPPLGGPVQRIQRLGSRFALTVQLPRLDQVSAQAWIAARLAADTVGDTLILSWPKAPNAAAYGAPKVNGAGQIGATLNAKGITANGTIPAGTFFSVTVSSRSYLYKTTAAATADASGNAALPIGPMLRASPADAATLVFSAPQIEGFIDGTSIDWDIDELTSYGLAFTLREIQ